MVAKFESVSPKLFFTPSLVINFRDGIPILQFRVMNAQGTLLDVENLTAQWAKPTKSKEGEIYGIDHTPQRYRQKFLQPRTPIKNFYLTGQDIISAGVGGALFSGVVTASAMEGKNLVKMVYRAKT